MLLEKFVEDNKGRTWDSLSDEEKKNAFSTQQYKTFEKNLPSIAPYIGFRSKEIPDLESLPFTDFQNEINDFLDSDIQGKQSMSSKVTDETESNREDIISNLLRSRRNLGRVSDKKDVLAKLSFDFEGEPIVLYTYFKNIPNGISDERLASELESHPSLMNNYVSDSVTELQRLTKAYAAAYNAVGNNNLEAQTVEVPVSQYFNRQRGDNTIQASRDLENKTERAASRLNNTQPDSIVMKSQNGEIPFSGGSRNPREILSIIADPNNTSRFRKVA